MKLILFLLRASWRVVLLAAVIGGISGAASVALVGMIMETLDAMAAGNAAAGAQLVGLFAALCVVILLTQVGSQVLLSRLTQTSIAQLRMGLCRRILESPLKHLEEIGTPRMLASLTGDVSVVSQAMNGVPVLGVNIVILVCGAGLPGLALSQPAGGRRRLLRAGHGQLLVLFPVRPAVRRSRARGGSTRCRSGSRS